MSGKSTYMRQLAMTAVMAQLGLVCASESAHLPIFDAIFTRIGRQMIWFQVNQPSWWRWMEANNAISHATKRFLDSL